MLSKDRVTHFDKLALEFARSVNHAMGEVYMTNDRAGVALAAFLDATSTVLVAEDTLHEGVALQPGAKEAVEERVRHEVGMAARAHAHVDQPGVRREHNWDAQVFRASLIILGKVS